jgi:hypothetical protein
MLLSSIEYESLCFGVVFAVLTAALIWAYYQPSYSLIKQFWWGMVRSRAESYSAIFGGHVRLDTRGVRIIGTVMPWLFIAIFAFGSIGLLARGVGIIKPPPQEGLSPQQLENLKNYELVTTDHEVYMRRKPATGPSTINH